MGIKSGMARWFRARRATRRRRQPAEFLAARVRSPYHGRVASGIARRTGVCARARLSGLHAGRGRPHCWPAEIYCPDDEAALERAKNLADGHAVELWEGDRRIALIDGKDGSSTPRAGRWSATARARVRRRGGAAAAV